MFTTKCLSCNLYKLVQRGTLALLGVLWVGCLAVKCAVDRFKVICTFSRSCERCVFEAAQPLFAAGTDSVTLTVIGNVFAVHFVALQAACDTRSAEMWLV